MKAFFALFILSMVLYGCNDKPTSNTTSQQEEPASNSSDTTVVPAADDEIIRYSRADKVRENTSEGRLYGCWQPNSSTACSLPDCKTYVKTDEINSRSEISVDNCDNKKVIKIYLDGLVYTY